MDLEEIKGLRDESKVFTKATLLGCKGTKTTNTKQALRLKSRSAQRELSDSTKSNSSETETAGDVRGQASTLLSPKVPSQLETVVDVRR